VRIFSHMMHASTRVKRRVAAQRRRRLRAICRKALQIRSAITSALTLYRQHGGLLSWDPVTAQLIAALIQRVGADRTSISARGLFDLLGARSLFRLHLRQCESRAHCDDIEDRMLWIGGQPQCMHVFPGANAYVRRIQLRALHGEPGASQLRAFLFFELGRGTVRSRPLHVSATHGRVTSL
jgi:hypothetical protein